MFQNVTVGDLFIQVPNQDGRINKPKSMEGGGENGCKSMLSFAFNHYIIDVLLYSSSSAIIVKLGVQTMSRSTPEDFKVY